MSESVARAGEDFTIPAPADPTPVQPPESTDLHYVQWRTDSAKKVTSAHLVRAGAERLITWCGRVPRRAPLILTSPGRNKTCESCLRYYAGSTDSVKGGR